MMENQETWKLIFVIPIAAIMFTIVPFFLAAWVSTMILVFKGFVNFAETGKVPDQKEKFSTVFPIKKNHTNYKKRWLEFVEHPSTRS